MKRRSFITALLALASTPFAIVQPSTRAQAMLTEPGVAASIMDRYRKLPMEHRTFLKPLFLTQLAGLEIENGESLLANV